MPEIGTLKKVEQGSIHLVGVSSDVLHPWHVETAVIHWEGDPYEGEYEVTPRLYEQGLATKHKTMMDDVTVHEIPVTITSNPHGGKTVLIG